MLLSFAQDGGADGVVLALGLVAAGLALWIFQRLQALSGAGLSARTGRVLAGMGVVAVVLAGFGFGPEWLAALGLAWTFLALGLAHLAAFHAMPLRPAHEALRSLFGRAGLLASWFAAPLVFVQLGTFEPSEGMKSFLYTGAILLASASVFAWASYPVLASRPRQVVHEGAVVAAHRNACPRCGRWFDRGLGRAPCTRCGLFVRLEAIDAQAEPLVRKAPEGRALPFGTDSLFACPHCGKRARYERGDHDCATCGGRLRTGWNIHVDAPVDHGPPRKMPRETG